MGIKKGDTMFNNIGKKLKVVGKVWFWIGVVFATIMVLAGLFAGMAAGVGGLGVIPMIFAGALYMLIFLVAAWMYYGLGEAVQNSEESKELIKKNEELSRQNNELLKKLLSYQVKEEN